MTPANPLRKSVPTAGMSRYWECGWSYLMPDFDHANHSIIEWLSDKAPVEPLNRVPEIQVDARMHGR